MSRNIRPDKGKSLAFSATSPRLRPRYDTSRERKTSDSHLNYSAYTACFNPCQARTARAEYLGRGRGLHCWPHERRNSGLGAELDATANEFGFFVGHRLASGRSRDRILQEVRLDGTHVLRIINGAVVHQLAFLVEEERLGRAGRAKRSRYIRRRIDNVGEREAQLLGALLHFGITVFGIFRGVVRIDDNHAHALVLAGVANARDAILPRLYERAMIAREYDQRAALACHFGNRHAFPVHVLH